MKGQKDQKLQKDKTNKAAASALFIQFKNNFDWKESDGETGAVFWYKTLILQIIQNPEAKIERPRLGNSPR